MRSIKTPVRILLALAFFALLAISLKGPASIDDQALTVLMEPDGTGVWRDLVSRFNREYSGSPIRLIEGPPATNTREDMYTTSFLSGKAGYDIVYCDVVWIPKFVVADWLLDLTDLMSGEDRADYLPVELRAGSYQGRLYRKPAFTDAGLLYYRKDLVKEVPETFTELMEMARQLKTEDRWGLLWQGKQYEGLITVYLEVLWGYGGEWIDEETRKVLIASPEAAQALGFLKATIGAVSPPAVTTYIEEDTRSIFQNGRAVFLRNWPYVWTLIRRRYLRHASHGLPRLLYQKPA
jgi:multiple sugar transport system substrate-binding protein